MRNLHGLTLLLASMLFARSSLAATAVQVPIGPRAIALAGAFTPLADDATALFWNPAGLTQVGHDEFSASNANLFGSNIRDSFGALAMPLSPVLAAATDWYHSGFDDGQLGFRENRIDAGFGLRMRPHWFVGANAKLITRSLDLDATSLGSSQGYGFDLGLLGNPLDHLRLGATVQDVFSTHLRDNNGGSQLAYPRALHVGASYAWRRWGTLVGQLDDRWHLGYEVVPSPVLALRAGVQADREHLEGPTWSCGLGLKAGVLRMDWAREFPPTLAGTDHFAAAFEFDFNPSLVRLERPQVNDIYASLQRSYTNEPIGSLRVRNLQDRLIEAQVSVFIPDLMDKPTEQLVNLRPQAITEVPLKVILGERVLLLHGDKSVQVQVKASYASSRATKREHTTGTATAYAPGAIDWSRGMAQAAAFVTPHDPAVESVARAAARAVFEGFPKGYPNRNLALMAAMVDALATIGVTYVADPLNPFATVSETPHAVDTIYYPSQTLARRTGDCDDTTVLLASLLESVGVPTRFVDAPGHIFLIAGTGVDETNALGLGVDSSRYVVRDHELWIPIETTATARGFLEAWRAGATNLADAQGPDPFVDVGESQLRYEPVLPPGEPTVPKLDEARLHERLAAGADSLAAGRDKFFRSHFGGGTDEVRVTAEALVDIARVHADAGDLAGARTQLERALERAPQSAMIHNDLGVVMVGLDSLEAAESHLRAALALADAPAGAWLNLGFVRWLRGDSASALRLLARGIRRAGGSAQALRQLPQSSATPGNDGTGDGLDPVVGDLFLRAERVSQAERASSATDQNSIPRLPVLPSGSRSKQQAGSGQAWYPRLVWWQ